MAEFQNIAERVLAVAEEHGDRIAVIFPDRQVSYARFRELVLSHAQHLIKHGVGRGSLVAIELGNVVMHAALALACALVGASWVSASGLVIQKRKLAWTHLMFGDKKLHQQSPTHVLVDATWSTPPAGSPAALDPAGRDDIWNYAESSGTTGEPKFTPVTFGAFEEALKTPSGLPEGMRPVIAFLAPPGSPASVPTAVVATGATAVCGCNYDQMLRAGANRVSGSPVQFAKLLANATPSDRRIYLAVTFGAAANEVLIARMLRFFERIKIVYATTEIGIISERIVESLPYDPSNVGKIVPSAEVMVVDDDDRAVPTGEEGVVRIRRSDRPWKGYANEEDAARSISRDGWFYPGDIGRISAEGELTILGRRDDRLNLGGVKVDASRIDAIIQNTPGVKDGYCFEDRNENGVGYLAVLLSLEDVPHPDKLVQEIYNALNASGLFYRIRRAYLASDIPRTETGKPLRRLAPDFVRKQRSFNIKFRESPGS